MVAASWLPALPHCFLPGTKGGLYGWEQARRYPEVILVEGLFDYAVLWQAGFRNLTCSLGTPILTPASFDSCATVGVPFISPSMSMPTAAANKLRGG